MRKNVLFKAYFQNKGQFFVLYFDYFSRIPSFPVLICRIRMHILILTGVQNGWISRWKNTQVLLKTVQFEAYFLRWRLLVWPLLVLYSDFLKMLSFSILILWHRYAHSDANSGSKRTHYRLQKGPIVQKGTLLKLNLQHQDHLYAKYLIYILNIYHKWISFSVLGSSHTHGGSHPNNGTLASKKVVIIC